MKRILSLIIIGFLCLSMFSMLAPYLGQAESSEPPATEWTETYGGAGSDMGYSMVQTSDGGYLLAGRTSSYGAGGWDIWLVKTDATGIKEWAKTYGGAGNDVAHSVIETGDGGYTIAGYTESFGAGGADFWLIKTDSTGVVEWSQTYGGTDNDYVYSIVETIEGGYALAGATWSFGAGGADLWLIKTDSLGNIEWDKTHGGTGDDNSQCIVQTGDGGYAIVGYTESYGAGWRDVWLVKTDSAGLMLWNKTYGGAHEEMGRSLVETWDGGYAIAGFTISYGAGNKDFWLIKTDASGIVEWDETYGGTGEDQAFSLVRTADSGHALAGYTASKGAGGWDFWLVKTDQSGIMEWDQAYGGTGTDQGMSVVETVDGGYAIAGFTGSFGAGSNDFWLIKLYPEQPLILPVPYYSQGQAAWCVPTSMAMIMKYYGHNIHPYDVADYYALSRSGRIREVTPLYPWAVDRYFKDHGLDIEAQLNYMVSLNSIKSWIANGWPVILTHMPAGQYGHTVVLTGYREADGDTIFYLNDPGGHLLLVLYGEDYASAPYIAVEAKWSDISTWLESGLERWNWALAVKGQPLPPAGTLDVADYSVEIFPTFGTGMIYSWFRGYNWLGQGCGLDWEYEGRRLVLPEDELVFRAVVTNHLTIQQEYQFDVIISQGDSIVWRNDPPYCVSVKNHSSERPTSESLSFGDILTEEGEYTLTLKLWCKDHLTLYDEVTFPELKYDISWEYVFEDTEQDTTLKISTDDQHFQFIASDKTFSVKYCPDMLSNEIGRGDMIIVGFRDDEITLVAVAVDSNVDWCRAHARDVETSKRYSLLDKTGIE